jgi:hypothetical protein
MMKKEAQLEDLPYSWSNCGSSGCHYTQPSAQHEKALFISGFLRSLKLSKSRKRRKRSAAPKPRKPPRQGIDLGLEVDEFEEINLSILAGRWAQTPWP